MSAYDVVVVGAGISGAVFAERFASQNNARVLVLDIRRHIAGNCFDEYDEHGVLVHRYGPHLFHTSQRQVWDYLSQFTQWRPYHHQVLAEIDEQLIPVPFNLNSLYACFAAEQAKTIEQALIAQYGMGAKVPILDLRQSDHPDLIAVADFIYQKLFVNYTAKQWDCAPEDIAPEVTARVPVIVSYQDGYFTDDFQAVPLHGYTQMIGKMLADERIEVQLNCDFRQRLTLDEKSQSVYLDQQLFSGPIIYTAPLELLFNQQFGALPYRSLRFEFAHHEAMPFQPVATVNYPNQHAYTRITEFTHITGQHDQGTSIVYEYPQRYDPDNELANIPYYPIFNEHSQLAYQRYAQQLAAFPQIIAAGRLAQYRYFDMDNAVANALERFAQWQTRVTF